MKKNQEFELTIEDLGNDGEGIGHLPVSPEGEELSASTSGGMIIFVKDAVPKDRVRVRILKVKKNCAYGRVMELLSPSPDRVEAACPWAKRCGGCSLQHLSYEAQLVYKWNKVKSCLERIGGILDASALMEPIIGMFTEKEKSVLDNSLISANICENGHWRYRNKSQFPVGCDGKGDAVTGFYASRSHDIVPVTFCGIQTEVSDDIIGKLQTFMRRYRISVYDEKTHQGLVRHILIRVGFVTGELMVCLIVNGEELPHADAWVEMLKNIPGMTSICLNVNREKTNRILGDHCITLWGQDYITDVIGDVKYQISPLSFFQVNPVQTAALYKKVLEYAGLTGEETVWDLYCGIGSISLFLARQAKQVYGVEIVPQAIADAKHNAQLNRITNAEFFVGRAEAVLPNMYGAGQGPLQTGSLVDVIVVDPPRKGCEESLLETIVKISPKRMVYVSCDPATLARDIKYMTAHGYRLEKVCAVDQFCHSPHVETVVLMSRVEK